MLMQLQANEQADVDAYPRSIRDGLLARDGRPLGRRCTVTDHGTAARSSPGLPRRSDFSRTRRAMSVLRTTLIARLGTSPTPADEATVLRPCHTGVASLVMLGRCTMV